MKSQCRGLKARGVLYADAMTQDWVRLALYSRECLNSLFLNAARHVSVCYQYQYQQQQQQQQHVQEREKEREHRFGHLADGYKLLCVRAVSAAITTSSGTNTPSTLSGRHRPFSDTVLAETLALAFDEVSQLPTYLPTYLFR